MMKTQKQSVLRNEVSDSWPSFATNKCMYDFGYFISLSMGWAASKMVLNDSPLPGIHTSV